MQTGNLYAPTVGYMPVERQTAINAGISLFELRYTKRKLDQAVNIFGPFDCRVQELDLPGPGGPRYDVKWHTGDDAYIRYEPPSGVAWMPDDMYWHNRVYLMDNPNLVVANLHTRDFGIVPGNIIRMEVGCLMEALKQKGKIFTVVKDGKKALAWYNTEEEAKAECDRLEGEENVVSVTPDGKVQAKRGLRSKYTVGIDERWDYKPEVRKMIDRYRRSFRFGWTECPAFAGTIRPKVIERINEMKKIEVKSDIPNEEQIRNIVQDMIKKNTIPTVEKEVLRESLEPSKAEDQKELYDTANENWLKMQKREVLAKICADRKLDATGGKYDLIARIAEYDKAHPKE